MCPKDTKISLSDEDISLIHDTSFFERKRKIFLKISQVFGQLEEAYTNIVRNSSGTLPEAVITQKGKISRGENYRGLPYLILDYPRMFSREGIFAFRTLFWWGHPFSFTFHVSGIYLHLVLNSLKQADLTHRFIHSMLCVNTSQWEHHFEKENYLPFQEAIITIPDIHAMVHERGFLKITRLIDLNQQHLLMETGVNQLKEMIRLTG